MGLFDRVFRGSDEMYFKAETEVNALIAETLTGSVVFRPLDPPQYVEIGIATPPAESMSPAAKRFLAFVREHLQG